jgi:hypothetical protein
MIHLTLFRGLKPPAPSEGQEQRQRQRFWLRQNDDFKLLRQNDDFKLLRQNDGPWG